METGDGCMRPPPQEKQASGVVIYLLEELGDARLRTAQLKRFVQEGVDLIDKHPNRDEIFEVVGHLIHGIPDTVFKLDKALDAAALAAARLDYEEIKQNLKPEKADELENVLQDVRLQYLKRRSAEMPSTEGITKEAGKAQEHLNKQMQSWPAGHSDMLTDMARGYRGHFKELESAANVLKKKGLIEFDGVTIKKKASLPTPMDTTPRDTAMKNAKEAADELSRLAHITETTGKLPVPEMMKLIAGLERQDRTASADFPKKASAFFRSAAKTLREQKNPERLKLAGVLRRVLADGMQMDAGTMLSAIFSQAGSREDVMKGFQKANPSMSDEDAQKAADMWERHQNVVKDKHQ